MHTVTLTIRPNEGTSRQDIEYELNASRADYEQAPGLKHLFMSVSPDNRTVRETSIWESKAAADRFLTHSWEANLSRRWQAAPMAKEEWETLVVA